MRSRQVASYYDQESASNGARGEKYVSLRRKSFQALTACGWIRDSQHLLIGGRPRWLNLGWPVRSATMRAAMASPEFSRRAPRLFANLPPDAVKGGWRA